MPRPTNLISRTCKLMLTLHPGEYFFTDASPQAVTNQAHRNAVKVRTEVCLLIEQYGSVPVTRKITKVLIV